MKNSESQTKTNETNLLERFSIECRKTKPKVIIPQPITTNTNYPMNQSELEANTCHQRQAWENACEQVAIGLSFTSDWWRKWREIFQPFTERSKAKPKQNANYFRHSNENRSINGGLG